MIRLKSTSTRLTPGKTEVTDIPVIGSGDGVMASDPLIEEARRDALARILDPDAWGLYDDKRMADRKIKSLLVEESRAIADKIVESGLMASYSWDRREYLSAKRNIINRTSRSGRCESVEDLLDGYFMHDPKCRYWPDGAVGGSDCVKQ